MFQNLQTNSPMWIRYHQKDGKWLIIHLLHHGNGLCINTWVSEHPYGGQPSDKAEESIGHGNDISDSL